MFMKRTAYMAKTNLKHEKEKKDYGRRG